MSAPAARLFTAEALRNGPTRGAIKTATYSLTHLGVAMSVAYALTGSWSAALAIGLVEPAAQTVAYVLHERAWRRTGQR